MDVGEPTQVMTPTLDGPVLTVLARAGEELTPGQVHRRCRRGSEPGVRRALARLVAQGIVLARPAGNAVFYSLNRDHLAASLVVELVEVRVALWARLREYLAAWKVPAVHVSAFGSAARGDGDEQSDIDLLVVRPPTIGSDESQWEAQIDELRRRVRAWTGNGAQIVELDRDELRRAAARGERLVGEVRRDGIGLMGAPFAALAPQRRPRRRRAANR